MEVLGMGGIYVNATGYLVGTRDCVKHGMGGNGCERLV